MGLRGTWALLGPMEGILSGPSPSGIEVTQADALLFQLLLHLGAQNPPGCWLRAGLRQVLLPWVARLSRARWLAVTWVAMAVSTC